jgi:hypothetical protein
VELLAGYGRDTGTVLDALSKYLAGAPITAAEQAVVQQALAVAGQPPSAAPPVTVTSKPPVTTSGSGALAAPAAPRVSSITKSSATIAWNSVPGAKSYILSTDGKEHTVAGTSMHVTGYGTPGKTYNAHVKAVGSKGQTSAWSANTSFTTKTK